VKNINIGFKRLIKIVYTIFFGRVADKVRLFIRLMQYSNAKSYCRIARYCSRRLEYYGNYISSSAVIGPGFQLPHPTSIVIGQGVTIGSNVKIYQGVTLGGRIIGDWKKGNYPYIGDETVIFAGVVVIGKVRVGKNCVIGANSVVITDIPDNSTAVGAPARVINIRH